MNIAKINTLLSLILFLFMFASFNSYADLKGFVVDTPTIDKILKSIPNNDKSTPYKNLGERLPKLGLTVKYIQIGKLQNDEIKSSKGIYNHGDVMYDFTTNEPNGVVESICPISTMFSFIKRGNAWLPNDRTANFLLSYKCEAP